MSSERLDRIRPKMQAYVDAKQLPGFITMVARRGKLVHFEQVGQMDVEAATPMLEDTIFRMYSMTKPITGVAVMILYEEGHFLLTDPVSKYLPEFGEMKVYLGGPYENPRTERSAEITIKQLLTHTSGLVYGRDEPGVTEMYELADIFGSESLQGFVERLAALPLAAQPGTEWRYSVSMDVLGRLVEVISGQPFDRFLAERIFVPLDMIDTGFYVQEDKLARFAAVYRATDEGGMQRIDDQSQSSFLNHGVVPYGGHGLVSTARDYMRFALMLLNGGELEGVRILGRKTVDLLMSNHLGPEYGPQPLASANLQSSAQGVGFGLSGAVITDPALSSVLGSTGNFFWGGAASTYFWIDPKEQLVGMVLTQLMPSRTYPIRGEMRILTYQAIVD